MKNFRDAALASSLVLGLLLGFVCLAVWWMQTNFGAISALATVGGVLGAGLLYVGVRIGGNLVRDSHRTSLENFTDGLAAVEQTRAAHARVEQERARMEREQMAAYTKFQTIDVHRVNQLATQQARLLVDTERERWDLQAQQNVARQPAAAWAMDDDGDDGAGVRYYE